ncbi:MAG TPA: hypothetical protein P5065_06825 [Candidatus Ratteibacteria bacterium]|nr:hypothetical protein [bacterium]HRS06736.1 hypothetical protein [Candidatus Ratteibacteria bacterium]HRV04823.1 hypothetical protein [Candidatus Ratteibacteria bacterium]
MPKKECVYSALIREAVENAYIKKVDYQKQLEALKRISSREGNVSDWETMKKGIREGRDYLSGEMELKVWIWLVLSQFVKSKTGRISILC